MKLKDSGNKDQGGTVEEALQTLTDSISDFNEEAKVCAQLRLGRMEETGQAVKFIAESMREAVNGTSSRVIGTSEPFILNKPAGLWFPVRS